MKGLLKYLSPFAPDQSGAVSVLYDIGGITVICDAGGCTGNICGFDEPRWFVRKSAIFSAGLRDMDAILGRDDRLIAKLKDTADKIHAEFAALIGTPVPAVIATDFRALKRMAEKRCNLPVITIPCIGTRLYDAGEEDTYLELFRTFTKEHLPVNEHTIGVIGATPLNMSSVIADQRIRTCLTEHGFEHVYCYGMGDGLDEVKKAGSVKKNLVIAPSGLKAAKYLNKTFGTPYEIFYPILDPALKARLNGLNNKKILVIHQQVLANEIRKEILASSNADVTVATWFFLKTECKCAQDIHLNTEEEFIELVTDQQFDLIIADQYLHRALRDYHGEWIHVPHFAVSGEYEHDNGEIKL
jgi:nitrogenase molybdenum-iron protein alpha/beta subunit